MKALINKSLREVDAWYHEESPGGNIGGSAVHLQDKTPEVLEMLGSWDDYQGQQ